MDEDSVATISDDGFGKSEGIVFDEGTHEESGPDEVVARVSDTAEVCGFWCFEGDGLSVVWVFFEEEGVCVVGGVLGVVVFDVSTSEVCTEKGDGGEAESYSDSQSEVGDGGRHHGSGGEGGEEV